MTKLKLCTIPLFLSISYQAAGQAHKHGEGTLFIAQEKNQWQLQYTLPAADIIGFEHAPETQQQRKHIKQQLALISAHKNVFSVPDGCTLLSQTLQTPNFSDHDEHGDDHDHHDDDTAHEHDEDHEHQHDADHEHQHDADHEHQHDADHEHDEDHHSESDHQDIELTFALQCKSFDSLTVNLFSVFPSLQTLDVAWATQAGQGSSSISAQSPVVRIDE